MIGFEAFWKLYPRKENKQNAKKSWERLKPDAAMFATIAAEQFGTNLRGTAATTAPNIVRWSAAWTGGLWLWLGGTLDSQWKAAALVAAVIMPIAMIAVLGLKESYGSDLDFEEE